MLRGGSGQNAHVGLGARGRVCGARPGGAPPGSGCMASWTLKTRGGGGLQRRGLEEEPCPGVEPSDPRGRWGSAAPRWLG